MKDDELDHYQEMSNEKHSNIQMELENGDNDEHIDLIKRNGPLD